MYTSIYIIFRRAICACILVLFCFSSNAQLTNSDSAFYYFKKSVKRDLVDTVTFEKGLTCLQKVTLSDTLIEQLEKYIFLKQNSQKNMEGYIYVVNL